MTMPPPPFHPDPVEAARIAEKAGAAGITVHLRVDRRHIQDADVERLRGQMERAPGPMSRAHAILPRGAARVEAPGGVAVCSAAPPRPQPAKRFDLRNVK